MTAPEEIGKILREGDLSLREEAFTGSRLPDRPLAPPTPTRSSSAPAQGGQPA